MEADKKRLKPFPPYWDAPLWYELSGPVYQEPSLKGNEVSDILIIGGGFTGLSCAYELKRRFKDKRILLVDAYMVGSGASGRNGGLMLNGLAFQDLFPCEIEAKIYLSTMATIKEICEIIQRHGIKTAYGLSGTLSVFTNHRSSEMAQRYVEKMNSLGLPIRYLYSHELKNILPMEGVVGAVLDPYSGHLNGLGYLLGLKGYLKSNGVRIYEYSPALRILEGKELKVIFPHGEIKSKAIMLATNAYTPSLGYFKREIMAIEHHVTAARLPHEQIERFNVSGFDDDRSPLSYGTFLPEGYVIFGGGTTCSVEYHLWNRLALKNNQKDLPKVMEATKKAFVSYFPKLRNLSFDHIWSGPIALTPNRMPLMGITGEYGNIYYALGYNGHGVTLANLGGKVMADLYCGNTAKWQDLSFVNAQSKRFPPDPIKYVGFNLYWKVFKKIPRFFAH